MHLIDNGTIEIEVETSEEAARAALAAAQVVFDDAGVAAAAAYQAWLDRGEAATATVWEEAQQAATGAAGGEARIALKGVASAFAAALASEAHEAEPGPFMIEQPIGGFEPEGPEFP